MKKSDLKEIIRQGIIQELTAYRDPETFEREYEEEQKYLNLGDEDLFALPEAKKKKDEEPPPADEEDVEITTDEEPATDEELATEEEPATEDSNEEILKTLEDLKNKVDDDKFDRLMNNAITYYTRNHVTKDEGPETEEQSLMENYELRRMKRIAGIIK